MVNQLLLLNVQKVSSSDNYVMKSMTQALLGTLPFHDPIDLQSIDHLIFKKFLMDGACLSQILQRLHERYISLYNAFTVAGEAEEGGDDDDVGTYQMGGNNFKSLIVSPVLRK